MTYARRKRSEGWRTRALTVSARDRRVQQFRVDVIGGLDTGIACVSTGDELTVGTAAGNHLVLTDGTVSRHHFAIQADVNGFVLRDLGSTNGTTLGGYRVVAAYLEPGAVIGAGDSMLRFDCGNEQIVEPIGDNSTFGAAIGESSAMRRVFSLLSRAAQSEATLLLEGETGTGKGVLAEAVHAHSARAGAPFVVVDCAAIVPSLIESELFGHVRGAFTGADRTRPGVMEAARGGTVFLDEVGELPIDLQPKLLRLLERRQLVRIGSTRPVDVDARVIAATNRDLRLAVNQGEFRSDLFYRLTTIQVRVPPLRERIGDALLLAAHFYRRFAAGSESDLDPPAELLAAVARHRWPGNVRELRNYIERAVVLGGMDERPHEVDRPQFDLSVSFRDAKQAAIERWERAYVGHLVNTMGGNLSRASRQVQMDRNHLRDLVRRHRIRSGQK